MTSFTSSLYSLVGTVYRTLLTVLLSSGIRDALMTTEAARSMTNMNEYKKYIFLAKPMLNDDGLQSGYFHVL